MTINSACVGALVGPAVGDDVDGTVAVGVADGDDDRLGVGSGVGSGPTVSNDRPGTVSGRGTVKSSAESALPFTSPDITTFAISPA